MGDVLYIVGAGTAGIIVQVLLYLGGAIPAELTAENRRDRVTAIRSGLLLIFGATFTTTGALAAFHQLYGEALTPGARVALSVVFGCTLAAIDHGMIERWMQSRGERELHLAQWSFPRMWPVWLLIGFCLVRLPLAYFNGQFVGHIALLPAFEDGVNRVLAADAAKDNETLWRTIERSDSAAVETLKSDFEAKEKDVAALRAPVAVPAGLVGAAASYKASLGEANKRLTALRTKDQEVRDRLAADRLVVTCEKGSGVCEGRAGRAGEGIQFKLAKTRIENGTAELQGIADEIAALDKSVAALVTAQADAAAAEERAAAETERRRQEALGRARTSADAARAAYLAAVAGHEKTVADRVRGSVDYRKPETDLKARLKALGRLDADVAFGPVRLMSSILTLLELAALLVAMLFRKRDALEAEAMAQVVSGVEKAARNGEQRRD